MVNRFVVTYKSAKSGLRQLFDACQGRYTYATIKEAQDRLDAFKAHGGLYKVMSEEEIASMKVMSCECYPGHFDPIGIYFEEKE